MFISEFTLLMETLTLDPLDLLIFGDFNFHVDDVGCNAALFLSLLDSFGLKQHISESTHSYGHTLDLVITRISENLISDISMHDPMISDHKAVIFKK